MEEELLYTQEDIDEWMRTCEELEENLREKRTEIKDLEQENKQLKEQNERVLKKLDLLVRSNQDLEQKLAIREKALELACVLRDDWNCKEPKRIKYTSNYDYFIDQAKDSIKGE